MEPNEIVLVDDASTEIDLGLLNKLLKETGVSYKYIRLTKNSGGPAIPRNIGMRNAECSHIAFLDQDDCWTSRHLKLSLDYLRTNGCDLVCSGYQLVTVDEQIIGSHKVMQGRLSKQRFRSEGNMVCMSSVVMKSFIGKEYLFRADRIWEDFEYWFRLCRGKRIRMEAFNACNVLYTKVSGSRSDGVRARRRGLREVSQDWGIMCLVSRWYWEETIKIATLTMINIVNPLSKQGWGRWMKIRNVWGKSR